MKRTWILGVAILLINHGCDGGEVGYTEASSRDRSVSRSDQGELNAPERAETDRRDANQGVSETAPAASDGRQDVPQAADERPDRSTRPGRAEGTGEAQPAPSVDPESAVDETSEDSRPDGAEREAPSRVVASPSLRDHTDYAAGFFTEVTSRMVGNVAKLRYGVAVTDVDRDGDFEAVVAGYNGANEVWDWQGEAVIDVTPTALRDPTRKAIGVAACDLDGDGSEEVYFLNIDQFGGQGEVADRLWRRDGDGWVDVFEQPSNSGQLNTFSGRSVACFDRDGDGRYGVFVANYGGPMKLFEYSAGALVDVAPLVGADLITGGRALVNVPLDGPQMNLFAGNENGANFFFVGDGQGNVTNEASAFGVADPSYTVRGAAVLDADADGDFDLVYGNWNGAHRLWLREGDTFVLGTPPEMESPSRIRTVIAADFDNDGTEEIFWNNIGEPNRLFGVIDNEWVTVDIGDALEADGNGTGAAVVDLDGDGALELLVSHGESGAQPLSLYVADARGHHYLRVLPLTEGGGPARGATVTLYRGPEVQRRVIDAGSGYLCQMEPVAHFGLGEEDTAPSVEVRWPDGHTVWATIAQVDRVYHVTRDGDWNKQN